MSQELKKNRLAKGLDVFGNLFILNIVFVLFSLPVVTIGASVTALYSVTLKMVRGEEGGIFKSFVAGFKANFKKATIVWMITLVFGGIIYVEMLLCMNNSTLLEAIPVLKQMSNGISWFYLVLVVIELAVIGLGSPFLYPLIARYDNGLKNTIKNSFLVAISNFGSWIKIFIAWFAPIFFTLKIEVLFLFTWYMWIFLFPALIAYGTSFTCRRVFDKISKTQEENAEKAAEEERRKAEQQEKSHREPIDKNVASIREQMSLVHKGRERDKKKKK